MFDRNDLPLEMDLRAGLRSLPVPHVTADFDSRVLNAVLHTSRGERFLIAARPVLSGAFCSLIIALALIHWSVQTTAGPIRSNAGIQRGYAELGLESVPLRAGSLSRLLSRRRPAAARTFSPDSAVQPTSSIIRAAHPAPRSS